MHFHIKGFHAIPQCFEKTQLSMHAGRTAQISLPFLLRWRGKRKLTTLKEHQANTKYNFTYFLLDIEMKILLYAKKQHISPDGLFLPTRFFLPVFNLSSK